MLITQILKYCIKCSVIQNNRDESREYYRNKSGSQNES